MENSVLGAKNLFYKKQYETASEIFLNFKKFYEAGLCFLLLNETQKSHDCFCMEDENLFASDWGLNVLEFIKLKMNKYPSYLQVRAFYEVYLNLLIENNLIDYAQNLINVYPTLAKSNPEIYKFIARTLYANSYYELSLMFTEKSEEQGFCDPEALFIAAQICFEQKDYSQALDKIKKILDLIPSYYPALTLKDYIFKIL